VEPIDSSLQISYSTSLGSPVAPLSLLVRYVRANCVFVLIGAKLIA